ncbi:MAG: hypothetical protein K0Q95_2353 [Bacteroidota bacterium]|jgi:macrodomain Ter protein organizer (MatP/YcbG family)|nr:hypothetical protein [Bacteroidota bacterium]
MEQYKKNNSGTSGVEFYEIEDKDIIVQFIDGSIYRYTYKSAGEEAVEHMKELAIAGQGLTTFIEQHVKDKYEAKLNESNY